MLLLLNVLPDVDVLHHSTDTLSHSLVVKVAVSYTNDTRLCGVKVESGGIILHTASSCLLYNLEVATVVTLTLAAQPCSTTKRSTPSMASRVMVYFSSSDVRQ